MSYTIFEPLFFNTNDKKNELYKVKLHVPPSFLPSMCQRHWRHFSLSLSCDFSFIFIGVWATYGWELEEAPHRLRHSSIDQKLPQAPNHEYPYETCIRSGCFGQQEYPKSTQVSTQAPTHFGAFPTSSQASGAVGTPSTPFPTLGSGTRAT